MLLQEVRFKNDVYGNPRKVLLKYNMPKEFQQKKREYMYPVEIIELGYQDIISHVNDGDIIMPTIYNWLSYSKFINQYK